MRVLYIAAECKPFSKVGGVGDVAGELPPALKRQGIDIEIVTPLYEPKSDFLFNELVSNLYCNEYKITFGSGTKKAKETARIYKREPNEDFDIPVYFVRNQSYFGGKYGTPYVYSETIPFYDDILRFSFFSEVCLELIKEIQPDIVHINDWLLGYLFGRMAIENIPARRVLTIHNIGYQGPISLNAIKGWNIEKLASNSKTKKQFKDPHPDWNCVNALKLGMELADRVNTVSPNYCRETLEPENQDSYFEGGKGLNSIAKKLFDENKYIGILNGFEYKSKPTESAFKKLILEKSKMKAALSKDFRSPGNFLLGFVGRAVEQKFKLLTEKINWRKAGNKSVLEHILDLNGINVAILATGIKEYEDFLTKFKDRDNCSITIAFDKEKARQISLGSDVFLMPSLFEPCGITQMESLSYATPPLVRWTGGLVDTVEDYTEKNGTGFGFDGSSREEVLGNLIETVRNARDFYTNNKAEFKKLQRRGFNKRFLWSIAATEYIDRLYQPALSVIR